MFRRLFLDHPRSVDETYREHLRFAGSFGLTMIGGGIAALVHGLVPALFSKTGSRALLRLNARLEESRRVAAERRRV
jgi:hypothetical protein